MRSFVWLDARSDQNQATAFDSSETCQCRRWKTTTSASLCNTFKLVDGKRPVLPDSPRVIEKLLAKGWIERKPGPADRVLYRITEKGTTAKKTRIP